MLGSRVLDLTPSHTRNPKTLNLKTNLKPWKPKPKTLNYIHQVHHRIIIIFVSLIFLGAACWIKKCCQVCKRKGSKSSCWTNSVDPDVVTVHPEVMSDCSDSQFLWENTPRASVTMLFRLPYTRSFSPFVDCICCENDTFGGFYHVVVTQQCSSEIRLNVSPGEHEKTSLFPHLQHLTESTKIRKDKKNYLRIMKQTINAQIQRLVKWC